ncbi:BrnA antitoxin family protein [Polycyclovorans algicola]|uniref:BrnA antitoxin family protein n=1 Tax=Polycyclovorans algicola TaxID=616992 RepID=UPI0004A769D2|nr:BrnA antitoxin family protein [Polycyclovorans algicola]
MPKLKTGTVVPTVAEDKAIIAAARGDADAKPLTDAQWKAVAPTVRMGRPPKAAPKEAVKLRLDPDVLAVLRASGAGWQTRVNAILRERFAL